MKQITSAGILLGKEQARGLPRMTAVNGAGVLTLNA